jgi:hypothetical protein
VSVNVQDGVGYATASALPASEADIFNQSSPSSPDPVPVARGQAVEILATFTPLGFPTTNLSYLVLQTDMGDGHWIDVAWCVYSGVSGTATFSLSGGIAVASAFQQTRVTGTSPTSNGFNSLPLGGRIRLVGQATTDGVIAVDATYKFVPVRTGVGYAGGGAVPVVVLGGTRHAPGRPGIRSSITVLGPTILPAGTLPIAVQVAGTDYPIGNPDVQPGMDTFTLSLIGQSLSGVPAIASYLNNAQPDDLLSIFGDQFDSGVYFIFSDGVNIVIDSGQASKKELAGQITTQVMPASLTAGRGYLVWPVTSAGTGYPVQVNKARPTSIFGDTTGGPNALVGDLINVCGFNLSNGTSMPWGVWVEPSDASFVGAFVTPVTLVAGSETEQIQFQMPATLNGHSTVGKTFDVWVHNGHFGPLGYARCLQQLSCYTAAGMGNYGINWGAVTLNISAYLSGGVVTPNVDTRYAFRSAFTDLINNHGGVGTILMDASGPYTCTGDLSTFDSGFLPVLRIDGNGQTMRWPSGYTGANPLLLNANGAAKNLTIDLSVCNSMSTSTTAFVIGGVLWDNCTILAPALSAWTLAPAGPIINSTDTGGVRIKNSTISGWGISYQFDRNLYLSGSTLTQRAQTGAPITTNGSYNLLICDNASANKNNGTGDGGNGRFWNNGSGFAMNIYLLRNATTDLLNTDVDTNHCEQMLPEAMNVALAAAVATGTPSGFTISNPTIAVTGAVNNGSNKVRLTVTSTATYVTAMTLTVSGIVGTTEANGTWAITKVDATHVDLVDPVSGDGPTFSNAYVSGGTVIFTINGSWANSRIAAIVAGTGLGQCRLITSVSGTTPTVTFGVEEPWLVPPDATSRINICTMSYRVAIVGNALQANTSNTVAATLCQVLGGSDVLVKNNTISNAQDAFVVGSYSSGTSPGTVPLFNVLFSGNQYTDLVSKGLVLFDAGQTASESVTVAGLILRGEQPAGRSGTTIVMGLQLWAAVPTSAAQMDNTWLDGCVITGAHDGIEPEQARSGSGVEYVGIRNTSFTRAPAAAGGQYDGTDGIKFIVIDGGGNSHTGFAS